MLTFVLILWAYGAGYTRGSVVPDEDVQSSTVKRVLGEVELFFTWPLIAYHLYKEGGL